MAGLEQRLARLEARRIRPPGMTERDAATFLDRLGALGAHVQAADDFTESNAASPAERYCRALLRGDGATAGVVMREALGDAP